MESSGGDQEDFEYVCLICLEVIANKHPIWNCASCYCMFHLQCIQSWSSESIACRTRSQQASALSPAHFPEATAKQLKWSCPKCRAEYEATQRPTVYVCFCGKQQNPASSGWIAPHSCGETCGRVRDCGHACSQPCHAGACSQCAVTVRSTCYCGQLLQTRRCAMRAFACGDRCGRKRTCGHSCDGVCHVGECDPCMVEVKRACQCGAQRRIVKCALEPSWQCGRECGAPLACGRHKCERGCHTGACGPCPYAGDRTCPCGKRRYATLACDQVAPRCDDSCDRLLACGLHKCADQCHTGACQPCLETVPRRCRCGARQREQACSSGEFTCDTRCSRMRDCGRHMCKRKCCLSNNPASNTNACPPCDQTCGRQLACGVHKCTSRCHEGACYPCTQTYELACTCGRTRVLLPCGRESKRSQGANAKRSAVAATSGVKLNCKFPCNKPPDCHHEQRTPHSCHPGDCPPCKLTCDKLSTCGHRCKAACHSAVLTKFVEEKQRIGPWEKPAEISYRLVDQPCPPCGEPTVVKCHGRHETTIRACSDSSSFSCGRVCSRPLACTNHSCDSLCHELANPDAEKSSGDANCAECERACERPRPTDCTHKCKRGACHPGMCPPCGEYFRIKCHCELVTLHPRCADWSMAQGSQREALQSCNDRCPKLMVCGHRCMRNCHLADCSPQNECTQRITLRCACKQMKRTVVCRDVELSQRTLPCGDSCKQVAGNDTDADRTEELPKANENEQQVRRRRKDKEAERLAKQQAKRDAKLKSAVGWLKMLSPLFVLLIVLVLYALLVSD